MKPVFFPTPVDFRNWLEEHHATTDELVVGYYKVKSRKPSITWPESVDEAICFGWIDGVRRAVDEESYSVRFTPRRSGSIWSAVNIKKAEELTKNGRMQPAGIASYKQRTESNSKVYSYENKPKPLSAAFKKQFMEDGKAWAFFTAQAPWYKRTITFWMMSAKQEKTRVRRLEKVIAASREGERLRR